MNTISLKHSPRPSITKEGYQNLESLVCSQEGHSLDQSVSFRGELLEEGRNSLYKMKEEENHFSLSRAGGEQGGLLLNATFLLLIVTLTATLSLKSFLLKDEESHQRKNTYLCFKSTLDLWSKHQRFIKHTNRTIIAIQAALALNPTPALLKLKRVTQRWQDFKNLSRWKKAFSNKYCSGLQLAFVKKSFPLQHRGVKLKRRIIGTVSLKKAPISIFLPSRSSLPFSFLITGKLHFSPQLKVVASKEVGTHLPTLTHL